MKTAYSVLAGGPGNERSVSLASAEAVVTSLQQNQHPTTLVEINTAADIANIDPNYMAINMIHGTFGEDGQLQSLLEQAGIRYTGENAATSELLFHKVKTKQKLVAAGVATPQWLATTGRQLADVVQEITLPVVIKEPEQGSSYGVHLITSVDELAACITRYQDTDTSLMIEEFLTGQELTVGIIAGEPLPAVAILPKGGFYSIANKYPWLKGDGQTEYLCPAPIAEELSQNIQRLVRQTWQVLDMQVYGRVDVMLDGDSKPYIIEVNSIPGMTESSLLPMAAQQQDISFYELICRIVTASNQPIS